MRGNKPKPDALKLIQGTYRPDRSNPGAPSAPPGTPIAPEWLSERAGEIFAQLCAVLDGLSILSPVDEHMISMLASRLEEIEVCTAIIEDSGRVFEKRGEDGKLQMIRARPEVAMRSEALRHAHSLLTEFGLSPATRNRVTASKPAQQNPFAALD